MRIVELLAAMAVKAQTNGGSSLINEDEGITEKNLIAKGCEQRSYGTKNIQRQYGNDDKEQVSGSEFCRIQKIFIKIKFQPVQDRIFHV